VGTAGTEVKGGGKCLLVEGPVRPGQVLRLLFLLRLHISHLVELHHPIIFFGLLLSSGVLLGFGALLRGVAHTSGLDDEM